LDWIEAISLNATLVSVARQQHCRLGDLDETMLYVDVEHVVYNLFTQAPLDAFGGRRVQYLLPHVTERCGTESPSSSCGV